MSNQILKTKILLTMGLLSLFSCSKKADLSNVFPYIITQDYLIDGIKEETVLIDTLIENELYLTLVKDINGLVENIKISDLKQQNISIQLATDSAYANLEKMFKEQKIKATLFDGPNDIPFIIFSDHWLAAASLYWTNLYSFANKNLKVDTFYVSVPQRDAMIIFPKCNDREVLDFKAMIKEKESDARKPLTWEIFQLDNERIKRIE